MAFTISLKSLWVRVVLFLISLAGSIVFIVNSLYYKKLKDAYTAEELTSSSDPKMGLTKKEMNQMYVLSIILSIVFSLLLVFTCYLLVVPPHKIAEHKEKAKEVVSVLKSDKKKSASDIPAKV